MPRSRLALVDRLIDTFEFAGVVRFIVQLCPLAFRNLLAYDITFTALPGQTEMRHEGDRYYLADIPVTFCRKFGLFLVPVNV
jgi:hypothetical protein